MFLNIETQKLPFFFFFFALFGRGEGALMMMLSLFGPCRDDGLAASPVLLSCDPSDVKSDGGVFLGEGVSLLPRGPYTF